MKINIIGILLIVLIVFSACASADTLILRPDGDALALLGVIPYGGSHYVTVDDVTPDDDSSYVYSTDPYTQNKRDIYTIQNATYTNRTQVNSVTLYGRGVGAGTIQYMLSIDGASYTSSEYISPPFSTWETNAGYTITTNPDTSLAWTWEDIDDLDIELRLAKSVSSLEFPIEVTQFYAEVEYDYIPPNTPVITSPSDSDVILSQPITITATGTDPEDDPLTYYYYADGTLLGTSDTGTFKWYAYQSGHYDLTVRTHDGYSYSDYSDAVTVDIVLAPSEVYDDNIMENLSGWWKLDDDFVDSSGNGNNGTNYGSTFVDGYIYNASSFDGDNDYIDIGNPIDSLNQSFSYSVWIKTNGTLSGEKLIIGTLNDFGGDTSLEVSGMTPIFRYYNVSMESYVQCVSSGNIAADNWAYLVGTYDVDSKTSKLYVNGDLECNVTSDYLPDSIATHEFNIGRVHDIAGFYFDGVIDDGKIYNDTLSAEQVKYLYNLRTVEPEPDSTQSFTYPPLLHDLTLTGPDTADAYKYQIATDSNFVSIASEGYVYTNEAAISLIAGDYWWRVFGYNETLDQLSDSSTVWQFDVETTGITGEGTAINGLVSEKISGSDIPIDDVLVSIYNDTWSSSSFTSDSGLYIFDNLANQTTYYIQCSKDGYKDSTTEIVTTGNLTTTTHNIIMEQISGRGQQYAPHYVRFIVKDIWGTVYDDVAVKAYEGNSVVAIYTEITGDDGAVSFKLYEDQQYRLTFINTTQGIGEELILYPKDDQYNVYVITQTIVPDDDYSSEEIDISVSKELINNSHAYINVTYLDNLAETESLKVYLNQSTTSDLFNQTVIDSYSEVTNNATISFIVEDYAGETYFVNVDVDHTTFDEVKRSYAVYFDGMTDDHGFSQVYIWLSIGGIMFMGMLFKANNSRYGAFVVCIIAWVFIIMEWFDNLGDKGVLAITAATTLATILSIAAIMAKGEKEG